MTPALRELEIANLRLAAGLHPKPSARIEAMLKVIELRREQHRTEVAIANRGRAG